MFKEYRFTLDVDSNDIGGQTSRNLRFGVEVGDRLQRRGNVKGAVCPRADLEESSSSLSAITSGRVDSDISLETNKSAANYNCAFLIH